MPADQLMSAAWELADRMKNNAPLTLKYTKEALRKGEYTAEEADWVKEIVMKLVATEDHKEAFAAIMEKKKPVFKGRQNRLIGFRHLPETPLHPSRFVGSSTEHLQKLESLQRLNCSRLSLIPKGGSETKQCRLDNLARCIIVFAGVVRQTDLKSSEGGASGMSNQHKASSEQLREELMKLPKETLAEMVEAGGRNCWSVQNHWMEYMLRQYGNDAAARADEELFQRFTRSMTYRSKRILNIEGDDIPAFLKVLTFFPMQTPDSEVVQVNDRTVVLRVSSCTMVRERTQRGLPLLPCKPAGIGCFATLATMVNRDAKVRCVFCPPDEIPPDAVCQWEFEFPTP